MTDLLAQLHAAPTAGRAGPLPVVVVSGFLGAGKSEVVARLVSGGGPRRVAWLVQSPSDLGEPGHGSGGDAALQGPPCDDLMAQVKRAALDGTVDVLVVESAGSVSPALAADTIRDVDAVAALARVHTAVTVVDAPSFLTDMASDDRLSDLGLHPCGEDQAVAEVRVAQVEYADVVVVRDEAPHADSLGMVHALVRHLNPRAQVMVGDVDPRDVLQRERFDAEATPWAAEEAHPLTTTSAGAPDDYGVSTVVYRARRPFHPTRLDQALDAPLPGLLRGRGVAWVASRPEVALRWQQAGPTLFLEPAWSWLAGRPLEAWHELDDAERATALIGWDRCFGDRAQDLAFTGLDLDAARLRATLDACLVTDAELAGGPDTWGALPDPFPVWDPDDVAQLPLRRPARPLP